MSGKVKAMPEVNRQPARWTGDVPVFVTSRNTSRSTSGAGRYMISLLTTGRVAYVGIPAVEILLCDEYDTYARRDEAGSATKVPKTWQPPPVPAVHSREPR